MPRRARLAIPGIPWHIIQRGNNRSPCFHAEADYHCYLNTLGEQAGKHGCAVHAYVLMTNHVHLLLTPEREDSVAQTMKNLGQRYVQYFNRTYRRSGTLWEGRYKSCLTQSEEYVLRCYRYIELNPVRARMIRHARGYRWSSYAANGEGRADPLVTPHAEYLGLATSSDARRSAYRALIETRMDDAHVQAIRDATNGNYVLGDRRLQREIAKMLKKRVTPGRSGRPKRAD